MIDLHSHILPGLDDGASTLDEAVEMARAAAADGIRIVAATPHHNNARYTNRAARIHETVIAFNTELTNRLIPLTVVAGQEMRVNDRFFEEMQSGHVLPLHQSRYLLLELPTSHIPKDFESMVYELSISGLVPLIAHPERNMEIASDLRKLERLIAAGALAQMTTHSLTGLFGRKLRRLSIEMCRRNLVHILASDAHNTKLRPFSMREAYAAIARLLGEDTADYYADNARAVIENREIAIRPVQSKSRTRFFW